MILNTSFPVSCSCTTYAYTNVCDSMMLFSSRWGEKNLQNIDSILVAWNTLHLCLQAHSYSRNISFEICLNTIRQSTAATTNFLRNSTKSECTKFLLRIQQLPGISCLDFSRFLTVRSCEAEGTSLSRASVSCFFACSDIFCTSET